MSDSSDVGAVIYKKGEVRSNFLRCYDFKFCCVFNVFFFNAFFEDESEQDDIWDDTELITAYDKAVNLAYVRAILFVIV